jgi:hypothetical protein
MAGYLLTKPTDHHDYRKAAVQAAESAYSAVATTRLAGEAELDGRLLPPYLTTILDDARQSLAGAAKQFTAVSPPDGRTTEMRDRLGPLLVTANAQLGEVESAVEEGDRPALRAALRAAAQLAEQLSDFLGAYE